MKKVHLIMQGKGGVGKSFVASLLAQQFMRAGQGENLRCYDTDPINKTLAGFRAIGAVRVELLEGTRVKEKKFDELMEEVMLQDKHAVIDNGASCFLPLTEYLRITNAIDHISKAGKKVIMHTVVTGGVAQLDTLAGLDRLATDLSPLADLVVWVNEYFGPVVTPDGRPFEEMPIFHQHKQRIAAVVRLAAPESEMCAEDLRELNSRKLTFEEAKTASGFGFWSRVRLSEMGDALLAGVSQVV
ncbi:MAG TPA: hypothetical protein VMK42_00130 [Anaeromyxobacteraceae bacterium]|nr:hypothetical protein [Anaeromyxobacteraceae bacterium]